MLHELHDTDCQMMLNIICYAQLSEGPRLARRVRLVEAVVSMATPEKLVEEGPERLVALLRRRHTHAQHKRTLPSSPPPWRVHQQGDSAREGQRI